MNCRPFNSEANAGGRSRRTFVLVMPRGSAYTELELPLIDFTYLSHNAVADELGDALNWRAS
jgi:hypothetical protein